MGAIMTDKWHDLESPEAPEEGSMDLLKYWVHDLKQPLTALKLIANSAPGAVEADGSSPEWAALRPVCDQIEALVEALADFDRMSTGDLGKDKTRFDVNALVAELVQGFQPRAQSLNSRLCAVLPGSPVFMSSDRRLLCRVLSNLIDNALAHGRADGRVTVWVESSGTQVRLRVEDDGPGFPPEIDITNMGTRRVSGRRGFGLGLLFCARACRALSGTLSAYSGPGGAKIRVELPTDVHNAANEVAGCNAPHSPSD